MSMDGFLGLCVGIAALLAASSAMAAPAASAERLWKPVPDEPYLQEFGDKLQMDLPVTSLAVLQGALYSVVDGQVKQLRERSFQDVPGSPAGVHRLRSLDNALWAIAKDSLYRMTADGWTQVASDEFVDVCLHLGVVYAATRKHLFRFENGTLASAEPEAGYLSSDSTMVMEDYSQVLADPVEIGPVERIASYSGTLYMLTGGRLALIDGNTFMPSPIDWGMMPSRTVREMLPQGSCLYITTDRGLAVVRGMALTVLRGEQGLPYEDTTCLAKGFDGDVWIGTTRGAIRKTGNEFHYFAADRWLPNNRVHDIAVDGHTVYIATDAGLGIVRYEPFTLAKKAALFERDLDTWGYKRLGFIHKLEWNPKKECWLREISDNDGGHTAHYLAAMSFKYAATEDESARQQALDAFKAMIWLEAITKNSGFIARAIWSVQGDEGKRAAHGSGGLPAKWYPTDDGLWLWKGDTSSDEVNGHMYSVSLFHDLAAKGPEVDRATQHIARIAAHIVDNGFVLRDMDGKPTRWGRWDPDYLLKPYGFEARGLNGMEVQTYMRTAFALTGDAKFETAFQQLLKWRYQTFTVRQKQTFPPDLIVPWDDELAFRCYHPLLTYTTDPTLRSIYLRSLERSWEVMRMQQLPFFNFIYGALTNNDCEAAQAAKHLREYPVDPVNYSFQNSHRADLAPQPGYVAYSGGTRAISPRETQGEWGSRSAIQYDGHGQGHVATPPIGWLEDYWMGRYYGFIEAPRTTDPALVGIEPSSAEPHGAAPYNGPPRPEGLIPGCDK